MSAFPSRPLSRRTMLAGSLAALGALALPGCAPAPSGAVALADADTLWRWVEKMVEGGPRFTGSPAHRRWIDHLAGELESIGVPVERFPTLLKYWNATSWALSVTDAHGSTEQIPVAYYWPYSGTTPAAGVTGLLAEHTTDADLTGKIVLLDRVPTKVGAAVLQAATDARPKSLLAEAALEDPTRLWAYAAPSLRAARERGAVGAIGILPAAPADAKDQFSPHQQALADLPAVQLDRVQGARLRALLERGPVTATLTLTADTDDAATVDYLVATLPGNGAEPGAILLMTHTDGQNAIEENGAAAVLAMTEYFAKIPREDRARDLCVVFSPAHMTAADSGVHAKAWLEQNPAITNRIVAAVVPEHLGAMQWDAAGGEGPWRPSGKQELLILGVGNSPELTRLVATELEASELERTVVAGPYTNNLYGEATGPYQVGIPTVTAIAGPNYLVQVAGDGDLDKLDSALAHRQTQYLTRVTEQLLKAKWLPAPR
ncbi:hypothetical protein ACFVVM_12040 [Nocardia sp. NPDC058176]|uniref:hypothetical protein n=1 Tax=Nocardia sp. NPDC058176 TaxID=3346368 RepID=UPI0036DD79E1